MTQSAIPTPSETKSPSSSQACTSGRITQAMQSLLKQQSYRQITINQVIRQAEIGRSTFYRYFHSKLDILVALHDRLFLNLLNGLNSPEAWLQPTPPTALVKLFTRFDGERPLHRSIGDAIGSDSESANKRIELALIQQLERQLKASFGDEEWDLPPQELAASLAALYLMHLTRLRQGLNRGGAQACADLVHRHSQALIRESLKPEAWPQTH